jgi:hypothetical protein
MSQILLEIQDEVNVRFLGVPSDLMETAQNELTYYVPGYVHMPAYKMGRWDGKIRLLGKNGKTYMNLVSDVVPIFVDAGYEILVEDNRYDWNTVANNIEYPDENLFSEYTWKDDTPIVLRDYQLDAVHAALDNGQGLLESATGSGKTLICAAISKVYSTHGKVVVIVPNIDLVIQTQALFNRVGLDAGIWYGERKDAKYITISTWQSLDHAPELFADVSTVIVDECFAGNTPVLTTNGWVPINNISVDDMVMTRNDDGSFEYNPVVKVHENITPPNEDFYELVMDDGTILEVTGNHKFLTSDGWVRCDELTPSHHIINKQWDVLP